jgi:hypothetical protein
MTDIFLSTHRDHIIVKENRFKNFCTRTLSESKSPFQNRMDNYFICIVSFFVVLLSTSFASPFDSTLEDEFRANAELVCYECARTPDNDTCALDLKHIPEVTAVGQVRVK